MPIFESNVIRFELGVAAEEVIKTNYLDFNLGSLNNRAETRDSRPAGVFFFFLFFYC